jgi:radical SAM superfamily enzyme YgiQ (UPF0313 family)
VYGCTYALYPIPNIFVLGYAAVLEREGHTVRFIDAPNERMSPRAFRSFLRCDTSTVYSIHSVNLSQAIDTEAHRVIRSLRPEAWIVFTGPAPTDRPDEFLLDERTVVARGEPDYILRDVVRAIESGEGENTLRTIRGLSFSVGEERMHNTTAGEIENLDELPFPARHLLNPRLYHNPKLPDEPMTAAITSRNCAYRCIYCVPNSLGFAREIEHKRFDGHDVPKEGKLPEGYGKFLKPLVRKRSPENVVREFRLLRDQGYRSVSIVDDQFLWEEERTIAICDGMKPLGLWWGCLARADRVTRFSANAMAGSGCRYVDLGIESFNPKTLAYIRKNATVERMREGVRLLQEAGIKVKVNMLLGANPNETEEEIWSSIREVIALKPETIMFSIVSPFPGTEFHEIAQREGYLPPGGYRPTSVQHRGITSFPHLSRTDLDRLVKQANLSFFARPDVIARNAWRLTRPRSAWAAALALKEKFVG